VQLQQVRIAEFGTVKNRGRRWLIGVRASTPRGCWPSIKVEAATVVAVADAEGVVAPETLG
jgi:hypothetical protein